MAAKGRRGWKLPEMKGEAVGGGVNTLSGLLAVSGKEAPSPQPDSREVGAEGHVQG